MVCLATMVNTVGHFAVSSPDHVKKNGVDTVWTTQPHMMHTCYTAQAEEKRKRELGSGLASWHGRFALACTHPPPRKHLG
jgi:hypothetical protein